MKNCIMHGGASRCGSPRGYRIQSAAPIRGPLWPRPGEQQMLVEHHCVAVAMAAKCDTDAGAAIEVVHVDSGEVVYRKPSSVRAPAGALDAPADVAPGWGPASR